MSVEPRYPSPCPGKRRTVLRMSGQSHELHGRLRRLLARRGAACVGDARRPGRHCPKRRGHTRRGCVASPLRARRIGLPLVSADDAVRQARLELARTLGAIGGLRGGARGMRLWCIEHRLRLLADLPVERITHDAFGKHVGAGLDRRRIMTGQACEVVVELLVAGGR